MNAQPPATRSESLPMNAPAAGRILISGGTLLDPASLTETPGDLAIADGQIVGFGQAPAGFQADQTINASGCLVLPGLVDLRARVGMPAFYGNGALESELSIAARYGITRLVCPPDTNPALDEPGLVHMLLHAAQIHGQAQLHALGALTRRLEGNELASLHTLARAGCVGFSQGDAPIANSQMLHRAMQYAATHQQTLWLRPLDANLGKGVAASGPLCTRMGLEGVPVAAETIALYTIFELVRATGVRVHLQGLSSAASIDLMRWGKKEGLPITCDVTINSLHLTDADIGFFDSRASLSPPLRQQRDRDALQKALADGTIDALVSDHSRVSKDGKALPFTSAQVGARGFELLLSLALHWQQQHKLPLAQALQCVTSRPAAILGQHAASLQVGQPADICLVNAQADNPINTDAAFMPLSPFALDLSGFALQGQVRATLVAGQVCYAAHS